MNEKPWWEIRAANSELGRALRKLEATMGPLKESRERNSTPKPPPEIWYYPHLSETEWLIVAALTAVAIVLVLLA